MIVRCRAQCNANIRNGKANLQPMTMMKCFSFPFRVHKIQMKNLLINLLTNAELNTVCAFVNKIQFFPNGEWLADADAIHRHTASILFINL